MHLGGNEQSGSGAWEERGGGWGECDATSAPNTRMGWTAGARDQIDVLILSCLFHAHTP
jgi:hypothetical protein